MVVNNKKNGDLANKLETKNEPFWLNPAKMEIEPTALGIEHDLL